MSTPAFQSNAFQTTAFQTAPGVVVAPTTFTSEQVGASADYIKYVVGQPVKTDRLGAPDLLDFQLAPIDNSFVKLTRGAYITITTDTYGKWFTGYVTNDPELTYLGTNNGAPVFGYKYQATDDSYVLSLRPIGLLPPFINQTCGQILKALAAELDFNNIFDVSGIQDGPLLARYIADPTKVFADIVQDVSDIAAFRFAARDKKLTFQARDALTASISINGNSKDFTPKALSIRPTTDRIANDVTVIGAPEPQNYITEYFVGDGFTAQFPLMSGVFGADSSSLISEDFQNSSINTQYWNIYDTSANWLQVFKGYLNVLGGSANGSFDVHLDSLNVLPLEGALRITHGQWDFVSVGGQPISGVIGGLWTQAPNSSYTGCFYALEVSKSGSNLVLKPIVNGVVDSTQTFIIDTTKRYVLRTLCNFNRTNRQQTEYAYLDQTGTVGTFTSTPPNDTVTFSTWIVEIDPLTGAVLETAQFVNSNVSVGSSTVFANYIPAASNDLHATFTGITVSVPSPAALAVDAANISTGPIQVLQVSESLNAGSTFTVNIPPFTKEVKKGSMIVVLVGWGGNVQIDTVIDQNAVELQPVSANTGNANSNTAIYAFPYPISGQTPSFDVTMVNDNNASGDLWAVALEIQGVHQADVGSVGSSFSAGYLTTLGSSVTDMANAIVISVAGASAGTPFTPGSGFSGIESNLGLSGQYKILSSPATTPIVVTGDTTETNISASWAAFVPAVSSGGYAPKIIGANEIDSLDGMAPIATLVTDGSGGGSSSQNNGLGTPQYNPGHARLTFFKDSTRLISYVPQVGDLVRLSYRRAGIAVARVQDPTSIALEASAWGDDGLRSLTRTDIRPAPRTSSECELAAAALNAESSFQHFEGTYDQYSPFEFTGEPVSGTVLKFLNLPTGFPSYLQAEVINEVQSTLLSPSPNEILKHKVSFGKPVRLDKAIAKFYHTEDQINFGLNTDWADIPNALQLDAIALVNVDDVASPSLDSYDATNLHMNTNQAPPTGGGFQVRFTDDSWGADAARNLIYQGTSQTFLVPRTVQGKACFIKAYDTRNKLIWSEDMTNAVWIKTSAVATVGPAINYVGDKAQVSKLVYSATGSVYQEPGVALASTPGEFAIDLKGSVGGEKIDVVLVNTSGGAALATKSVVLTTGWQRVSITYTGTVGQAGNFRCVVRPTVSTDTPTIFATRSSFEIATAETAYFKTASVPFGAMSRFASGVRVNYPLIPPAPTADVNFVDPANPVIDITLPAVLEDVWGVELRASDNTTVIYQADLTDASYLPAFTIANNASRTINYYAYTYNLLGEYCATPFHLNVTIPTPSVASLAVDETNVKLTWAGTNASKYLVEIATDSGFTSIILSKTVTDQFIALDLSTVLRLHYYRVTPQDAIGSGTPATLSHSHTPLGVGDWVNTDELYSIPAMPNPVTDITVSPAAFVPFTSDLQQQARNLRLLNNLR